MRGFTLVEMMIALMLLGIVLLAVTPRLELIARTRREQELHHDLRMMRQAIDAYKKAASDGRIAIAVGASGFPPSLATLVDGVTNALDINGAKLYFLRRIPRDPMSTNPSVTNEETWGLRSYASPATDPQPGADVFDVYSQSPGMGLNGIAYRKW